jgi:hypothetical protein
MDGCPLTDAVSAAIQFQAFGVVRSNGAVSAECDIWAIGEMHAGGAENICLHVHQSYFVGIDIPRDSVKQ